MRSSLQALLDEKPILLADGATGTNFMEMGLEPGFPPDLWNLSETQKPTALHQMLQRRHCAGHALRFYRQFRHRRQDHDGHCAGKYR